MNAQGPDVGTQYRSAIFFLSPEQEQIAKKVTAEVQEQHFPKDKIATKVSQRRVSSSNTGELMACALQIEPAGKWWNAEDYHQECESPFHCFGHGQARLVRFRLELIRGLT